jgi:hypothetical protein
VLEIRRLNIKRIEERGKMKGDGKEKNKRNTDKSSAGSDSQTERIILFESSRRTLSSQQGVSVKRMEREEHTRCTNSLISYTKK